MLSRTSLKPGVDWKQRRGLPLLHGYREPACEGLHGVGGSIIGTREAPEQAGDRVVLFIEHILVAAQTGGTVETRSGGLCLLSGACLCFSLRGVQQS